MLHFKWGLIRIIPLYSKVRKQWGESPWNYRLIDWYIKDRKNNEA